MNYNFQISGLSIPALIIYDPAMMILNLEVGGREGVVVVVLDHNNKYIHFTKLYSSFSTISLTLAI